MLLKEKTYLFSDILHSFSGYPMSVDTYCLNWIVVSKVD